MRCSRRIIRPRPLKAGCFDPGADCKSAGHRHGRGAAMSDPVPAIAEASATGAVAEIFADIRQRARRRGGQLDLAPSRDDPQCAALGLGNAAPALRRRHDRRRSAALHGQLALAAPSAFAARTTGRDRSRAATINADPQHPRRLRPDQRDGAGRVVGAALPAGRAAQRNRVSRLQKGPNRLPEPLHRISLPPLPGLDTLPEPVANLVLTLNRFGTRRENPVLASMYRHLAYWPGYLALGWALIAPLDADGSLERGDRGCSRQGADAGRAPRGAASRAADRSDDRRGDPRRGRAVCRRRHCQDGRDLCPFAGGDRVVVNV